MLRHLKPCWLPALLGLAAGLVVLSAAVVMPGDVLRVQVSVSDYLFLADSGPRFGRLPVSDDIVLVVYDDATLRELGRPPTYDEDLALYRVLLDAGAKVVADTRMVADGGDEESAEVHGLLESMMATGAEGRLFRDIWVNTQMPEEFQAAVEPFIANHLLNTRPNADSYYESRLYPLALSYGELFRESLPLVVARAAKGLPRLSSDEVREQIKSCGISAALQEMLPEGAELPEIIRADGVEKQDYRLGDVGVPWAIFGSTSPTIVPAAYWVNYAWSPAEYERVPYTEVVRGEGLERVDGKIVLVGFDAMIGPQADKHTVPNHPQPAGSPGQVASSLQTLLEPGVMRPASLTIGVATVVGLAVVAALVGGLLKPVRAGIVVLVLLAVWLAAAMAAYRSGWLVDMALTPLAVVLGGGLGAGRRYLKEVRWRLRIVDLFGRYVPRAVVTQLVQQPDVEALALGGVKREVTVLFADIRGFTAFAEKVPPEEVIGELNSLLGVLVECTFAHDGTVDKFIGDAILVLFNAPLDQPDHTERAARTALAMQRGIADHASGLTVGIGIHRGEAVVGRVGTPERMEFTAIGSTVNLASRLCGTADSGAIVVSQPAAEALAAAGFALTKQAPMRVKGIEEELRTSLLGEQR